MKLNFIRSLKRNKKGISTVIATIIIVAISIVMAISVAYWALGIGNSFTRFEKLQFNSAYPIVNTNNTYSIATIIKNTGTATATVDSIFLNGQPITSPASYAFNATSLAPGDLIKGNINLPMGVWSSGMSVEVSIQTAAGNSYPKTVALP